MTKPAPLTTRPQLDPWPSQGVGPGPLSPFWRREVDDAPPPSDDPVAVLYRALSARRRECFAELRNAPGYGVSSIATTEIEKLNTDLAEVQRLNAGLRAHRRSPAVAAWSTPVLPLGVLFGPRELASVLGEALRVLVTLADERRVRLDG
jgi:hypothetical protein